MVFFLFLQRGGGYAPGPSSPMTAFIVLSRQSLWDASELLPARIHLLRSISFGKSFPFWFVKSSSFLGESSLSSSYVPSLSRQYSRVSGSFASFGPLSGSLWETSASLVVVLLSHLEG